MMNLGVNGVNNNLPNIDLMGALRGLSSSADPKIFVQGLLKDYPQIQFLLQAFINAQNFQGLLEQFFGNVPAYQQIKKDIEGKSREDVIQYLTNRYKEQGVDFNNLIQNGNKAIEYLKQSGLIK